MDFALPEDITINITATYHATDKGGGAQIETVAPVSHGKGSLKGVTRYPVLVYLSLRSSKQATVVYAERGDNIKVTGDNNRMETWKFGGNELNERWSAWRNAYADTISSGNAREINLAVAKYVYANPSDPLSTLLLLTSFSRSEDEGLFRSLWFKLTGEARDPKWTNLVSRADQPTMALTQPAKLHSIVMRSASNGVDTLHTDSVKASLFFFWASGVSERQAYIDSLKSLVKAYPDSSSRIIADVFIDADSMAWRAPLKRDSLSKVNRLWAPAGMADSRIMQLEVRQSPFLIVFSKDGNQRYRGTDISAAFKEFKSLME
ncbi:MAG: DUF4369 domain-containing protein [Bacteroides sp.]|nr:DUF4369 domain-containing protein [Bacteroides sp.]